MVARTTLGLMSNRNPEPVPIESMPQRRLWTAPQLVIHDSMMVLTQHFFGVPAAPTMLLGLAQISCVVGPTTPVC
jgi:hypothetical protein